MLRCHPVLQWGQGCGARCSYNNPKAGQPVIQESGNRASLLVPRTASEHSASLGRAESVVPEIQEG